METRNEKKYQHNAYILCASKILLTLSVVIICASIATAVGPEYEVIDLGTLSGGSSSALAINNSNVVVGESGNNAFMWIDDNPPDDDTSPGEMRDFGAVSAVNYSWGEGINTAGDIVGFYGIDVSDPSNILGEAFLWEDINSNNLYEAVEKTLLGTLPGGDQSRAFDISNSGKITGVSNGTDGIRAFIYDIGTGTMDTLGPDGVLGTGTNSWGYSINDAGWVVGNAEFDNLDPLTYEEHAFIWKGTDLEDLSMPGTNSRALAISEGGVIIGSSSYDVTMKERAAKWEYNIGTGVYDVTDLGAIQGAAESVALGINIGGDIVGWSLMDGTAINRAFIYSDVDNTMYDLNDQLTVNPDGWTLSTATGINDFGWIIGEGQVNGEYHAFILKPVPEPATMMLMALGGLMIRKRS